MRASWLRTTEKLRHMEGRDPGKFATGKLSQKRMWKSGQKNTERAGAIWLGGRGTCCVLIGKLE